MKRTLSTLVALSLLISGPASALSASGDPRTSGPLLQNGSKDCEQKEMSWKDGTVALDAESCFWWFQYVPVAETDIDRDFGVLWLQVTFQPRRSFCIEGGEVWFQAGKGFTTYQGAPQRSRRVRKARDVTVRIVTDADGQGPAATVEQDVRLQKGRLQVAPVDDNGWLRVRWSNHRKPTDKPVSFALGVEVSWTGNTIEQITSLTGSEKG